MPIRRVFVRYAGPDAYHKRMMTQLIEWVAGRPIHNPIDNECVPDFSCCRGRQHMAPRRLRELFFRDEASRAPMIRDWTARFLEEDKLKALQWDLPCVVVMTLAKNDI